MKVWRRDIPVLPVNVAVDGSTITDMNLAESYPVNEAGSLVLRLVDGRRSIEEIARAVACEVGMDRELALADALQFFGVLNDALLMNIRVKLSWERLRVHLLQSVLSGHITSLFDWPRFRLATPQREPLWQELIWLGAQTLWTSAPLVLLASLVLAWASSSAIAAVQVIVALLLSICAHEYGHWSAIVLLGHRGSISCLSRRGMNIAICRRPLPGLEELTAIIMGPAVPAAMGLLLLSINRFRPMPGLAEWGTVFALHLVALLPIAQDGQNLVRVLRRIMRGGDHD